jgi:prepilin-type N-terminal cleavage/methylation domain-containing protein
MTTPFLFCGFRCNSLRFVARPRRQSGVTLLELIIVLVIIGAMASLMFPAIQSARAKANTVACQNNVRQVGMALGQFINAKKRFPFPNQWTIDILKWMEEEPLSMQFVNGVPATPELARPPLLRCAGQPEVNSTVPSVFVSHYVLAVDRPYTYLKGDRVRWEIHDRPLLTDDDPLTPWYVGAEISFAEQQKMFETMRGPHPGGIFYTHDGAARGGIEN